MKQITHFLKYYLLFVALPRTDSITFWSNSIQTSFQYLYCTCLLVSWVFVSCGLNTASKHVYSPKKKIKNSTMDILIHTYIAEHSTCPNKILLSLHPQKWFGISYQWSVLVEFWYKLWKTLLNYYAFIFICVPDSQWDFSFSFPVDYIVWLWMIYWLYLLLTRQTASRSHLGEKLSSSLVNKTICSCWKTNTVGSCHIYCIYSIFIAYKQLSQAHGWNSYLWIISFV